MAILEGAAHSEITGRANYQSLTNDTGIDFIENPGHHNQESNALLIGLWFGRRTILNNLRC